MTMAKCPKKFDFFAHLKAILQDFTRIDPLLDRKTPKNRLGEAEKTIAA
jgi:hypothetical protein